MLFEKGLGDVLGEKEARKYLDPVRREAAKAAATRAAQAAGRIEPPNRRHFLTKVTTRSSPRDRNTVIEPWVDVDADLDAMRTGKANRQGGHFIVNGRTYGQESSGRLYPISGPGFLLLDRGAYRALMIYNTHGDTDRARHLLDLNRILPEAREEGRKAWLLGRGKGA